MFSQNIGCITQTGGCADERMYQLVRNNRALIDRRVTNYWTLGNSQELISYERIVLSFVRCLYV